MKLRNHVLMTITALFASVAFAVTMNGFTEIAGTTNSYTLKDKDGVIDFSLVMPAMSTEELMNFDLARIISPDNDALTILSKKFEVPSNMSAPKQTESYFLSFTIEKPEFRAYVRDMGNYNLYALHGSFPVKKVVDAAQSGQSLFEMVNLFTFKGGGSELIEVKGPTKDVKIAINEWSLGSAIKVSAPTVAKGKEVLAFTLFKEGDELYPADIKRVLSGTTETLTSRAGSDSYVLSVLVNNTQKSLTESLRLADGNLTAALFSARATTFDLNQISYTLQPLGTAAASGSAAVAPAFLPQIAAPLFDGKTIMATLPQTITGVDPYATVITLSEVTTAGTSNLPLDFKNQLWSTEQMGWVAVTPAPAELAALLKPGTKYALEVIYLGTSDTQQVDQAIDWEKVSHVTRNALTIKP